MYRFVPYLLYIYSCIENYAESISYFHSLLFKVIKYNLIHTIFLILSIKLN